MSIEGNSSYQLDREVGRGAFAAVYLAHRTEDGLKVAIKHVLRKSRRVGVDWTALREVKLLRELQHENIVRVLDVFALPGSINMVMELCPFDLKKVIDNKAVLLTEEHIKSYMKMMLVGTKVMHEFWVLHRVRSVAQTQDLKPDNLLIGDDRRLKLADFGLARIFGDEETRITYKVVTLPYRAPELLFGAREYGVGVDIWSIGCIMAELMARKIFLPGTSDEDQLGKIFWMFGTPTEKEWPKMAALKNYVKFTERSPVSLRDMFKAYSAEAIDLLEGLMKINPLDRLTAQQALEHKFFTTSEHPATPPEQLPFDALKS